MELGVNSSADNDDKVLVFSCERRMTDDQKVEPLNGDVSCVARNPSGCFKADQIGGGLEDSADSLTMDAGGGVPDIHSNQKHRDSTSGKIPAEVCRYSLKPVITYLVDENGFWVYSCLWEKVSK